MVEITLTVVAAYGSFAAAQQLGLSGVLATVAAGVLCGHDVARRGMTATTRVAVDTFWEYGAFALNSIVFLLIGFEVHFQGLVTAWRPVVAAFVAVTLARVVVVSAVTALVRPTSERIPLRWSAVLTWGGVRGALSMVLALALPVTLPYRGLLITMTFGVVPLSLLGQGLTMPVVLRGLKLVDVARPRSLFEGAREEFRAAHAAVEEIDYLTEAGVLSGGLEARLRRRYDSRLGRAEARLRQAVAQMTGAPVAPASAGRAVATGEDAGGVPAESDHGAPTRESMAESVRRVERYLLDVERDRLGDALRAGQLPADAYDQLIAELDVRRAALTLQ
jgi:monovalent cation:H+ antiporter, CPA1 family